MAIAFLNFLAKSTQIRHFWFQFWHFHFFTKFCSQPNSKVLISNITISFSNLTSKISKTGIMVSNLMIQIFAANFAQDKFKDTDFKYDNIFFKFQPKNTQIRHFWVQIQVFSLFHEILQLDKFEGADFKRDKIVFEFQSKNIQIRHFWSQIWAFLFLCKKLQSSKFEGATFKYDASIFPKNVSPKLPKYNLWSHIQAFLFFMIIRDQGTDFNYSNIVFNFQSKNTQIRNF